MSYRDLGNDDAADVEHVVDATDAPDPRAQTQPEPERPSAAQAPRWPLVLAGAALIAAAATYVATRPDDSPPPNVEVIVATAPPAQTNPSTASGTAAPAQSPTTPPAPAPTAPGQDEPAVPRAQAAVAAFLPAWTMKGTSEQRRAALTTVTTPRLVDALAGIDPSNLPTVTGETLIDSATAASVVVDVPTSDGLAQLTVQPVQGRWIVTAVSLKPAAPQPPTTSTAPTPSTTRQGA